jgi:glycerol-3-phosphate O-acyltransferase / dihydroxyacetone phosphate acyltransferase
MIGSVLRAIVAATVAIFYRLERVGPGVPPGPVLLVANHPNSLLDPLILFRTAGRRSRPLARAPLFDRPVLGFLMRAVGAIPIYRREDDPSQMSRNRDSLRAAIQSLLDGDAVQIFPEGRTHSDPSIAPLRTGAARIALGAEAEAGWRVGVQIVPVGLTYARKAVFRGHAVALYGETLCVGSFRSMFQRDEQAAVRALTAEIDARLRALTLDLTRSQDADLIDAAERVWSVSKGLRTSRQRVRLADRIPRLQAFARGLAWLRAHQPDRHRRLAVRVRRYQRIMALLGAGEGDVPEAYRLRPAVHWLLRRGAPTVVLAPVAAVAAFAWAIPYGLVRRVVGRMDLPPEVVATYKVGAGLLAYPLMLTGWVALTFWFLGWRTAAVVGVLLPVAGLVAVRWLDLAAETIQDLRLLARLYWPGGRTTRARQLARVRMTAERRKLTAEFDAIRELMESDGPSPEPPPGPRLSSSGTSLRRTS